MALFRGMSFWVVAGGRGFLLFAILACVMPQQLMAAESQPQSEKCSALAAANFHNVQEAPTQILAAHINAASAGVPSICDVKGYVNPNVGFELEMPLDKWNSKFIHVGSGGHGGSTSPASCEAPLAQNYACLTSDMGHQGTGEDGVWAANNMQAKIDWGYRATHVATLAGKAIVEQYYGRPPSFSYFAGCSTGGRQALQEAQRFPWDFNGIIAGAPPIRLADLYVTFAWGQRAAFDSQGKRLLNRQDLKLLTEAALAKCDMDDGLRDGIIGAPMSCAFRPSELACRPGQKRACLNEAQVAAAQKIYDGPKTSAGKSLFGAGALPGSEYGGAWNEKSGGNWGIYYLGVGAEPAEYSSLTVEGLRTLFSSPEHGPTWSIGDFDFDTDFKRLDVMESIYDSSNPDLSRFRAAGGKLIIYHGLNDLSILPQWIIGYYRKVVGAMGGQADVDSFVRLYSLPGMEHCDGGPGADSVDYLAAVEQWVEHDHAPGKLTAYHLKPSDKPHSFPLTAFPLAKEEIAFSRPVYPYPVQARYDGHGDPNVADSFYPFTPPPGR